MIYYTVIEIILGYLNKDQTIFIPSGKIKSCIKTTENHNFGVRIVTLDTLFNALDCKNSPQTFNISGTEIRYEFINFVM